MESQSPAPSSKLEWGDADFEQEEDHETEPDENGIKYVVQYKTNEDGKRVRITRKVRVYKNVKKVAVRVDERQKRWKKFGKAAAAGSAESAGITYRGEEVFLVLGEEERKEKERIEREKKDKQELEAMYTSMIAEGKKPGGPMLPGPIPASASSGAPSVAAAWIPSWKTGGAPGAAPPSQATAPSPDAGDPSRYVAPHKRSEKGSGGGPTSLEGTDYTSTIRVTNLSEETTENDLQDMFRKFGHVQRVYLVKDKLTNQSRGFAFITFTLRKDAQKAMEEMNGQGWDYLILSIEWAKPSAK